MIDFTLCPTRKKAYGGANGSKISIIFNDELYMLKLPTHSKLNSNLSYTNSALSEYLGCHIFNMVGIKAQETILGIYDYHGVRRNAVACKDFTSTKTVVLDFASIKNKIIDSASNGYGTELYDILDTIHKQDVIDPIKLEEFFWNMFIIDAFIGNFDRHNGNWGFLYNQETDEIEIAPIFDCGSTLYPQADEEMMKKVLSSKTEMQTRIYDYPTSSIVIEKKKINYYKFINSLEYEGCNKALKRIYPKINLNEINKLIDECENVSDLHKDFLKKMLKLRKEIILDDAFKALNK